MPILSLHSEKFSPDGNLSAEGFENLLGTPSLDFLEVLVREAVQNSCDATRSDPGEAEVRIRIRQLDEEQRLMLANGLFAERPDEITAKENLARVLDAREELHVMEIADYGTSGLSGPTRADQQTPDGEKPDFVNFFRNIGAARDVEGGGGTYGYGKATLYRASRAHIILVHTFTTSDGQPVHRLMGAQIGKAVPGKYTGRHWWGTKSGDGSTVEPLIDAAAVSIVNKLGMPSRDDYPVDCGTTVMIIAPHLPDKPENVVSALREIILWNFWPRMMDTTPKGKILRAMVTHDCFEWEEVEPPECFPPLTLLCRAMNAIRFPDKQLQDTELIHVECLKPKKRLGVLALTHDPWQPRRWLLPPHPSDESENGLTSIIPERLHHVALMRPAQLVVRYETGNDSPDTSMEWGGVFICSEDPEVEKAFARSEPPAHDDWQPEALPPKSRAKRYVNVALRRIRGSLPFQALGKVEINAEEAPLGRASEMLGRLLPGGHGEGAAKRRDTTGTTGTRPSPFTQPRPAGLEVDDEGHPIAVFCFDVKASGDGISLVGKPRIAIDGGMAEPDEATGIPKVLDWQGPGGVRVPGPVLEAAAQGTWEVRVSIPGEVAVGLRLAESEGDRK